MGVKLEYGVKIAPTRSSKEVQSMAKLEKIFEEAMTIFIVCCIVGIAIAATPIFAHQLVISWWADRKY